MANDKKFMTAAWIAQCKNRDPDAFETLVQEFTPRVYSVCISMLGEAQDAKDAAQETFIKIYHALPNFREKSSIGTWIYRIAVNVCKDMLRKKSAYKIVSLDDDDAFLQLLDTAPTPEESFLSAERQRDVQKAIASLPPEYRVVVTLRDIKGLSYGEISEVLEVPLNTVKSRISRARNLLFHRLTKKWEPFSEATRQRDKEARARYEL